MSNQFDDYTARAEVVNNKIQDLNQDKLLELGIECCERCAEAWGAFKPDDTSILAGIALVKKYVKGECEKEVLERFGDVVDACQVEASDAEGLWAAGAGKDNAIVAFRANMSASSVANLFWAATNEDDRRGAIAFCLGLSLAACDFAESEMQFQDRLIESMYE